MSTHASASAFHRRGWLETLKRTYSYEPLVVTTAAPGEPLRDGIVLCRVASWLTGTRLVSLPFADHCALLLNGGSDGTEFTAWLREEQARCGYRYVELRPPSASTLGSGLESAHAYVLHDLDLRPSLEKIFDRFHKDSVQRRIRRAEKEHLSYEVGRSGKLLDEFYRLLVITRRRHQLPPQPRKWFTNLVLCMGDDAHIRLVRKQGISIAAIFTLQHRSTITYKYGCSDEKFHHLGCMPFLFWRLIEESKQFGFEQIDFGRSDLDNAGLLVFKDRFGTTRKSLTYYRYPQSAKPQTTESWGAQALRRFFSSMPDTMLSAAGSLLYRHIG